MFAVNVAVIEVINCSNASYVRVVITTTASSIHSASSQNQREEFHRFIKYWARDLARHFGGMEAVDVAGIPMAALNATTAEVSAAITTMIAISGGRLMLGNYYYSPSYY